MRNARLYNKTTGSHKRNQNKDDKQHKALEAPVLLEQTKTQNNNAKSKFSITKRKTTNKKRKCSNTTQETHSNNQRVQAKNKNMQQKQKQPN